MAAGHEVLANVSLSKVWTILDEEKLKLHRIKYCLERRDPDFDEKMLDVLEVYKDVELVREGIKESEIVNISQNEKPGIQAIANIAPDLPPTVEPGSVKGL
jgi:hypothetical protein